ncbi:sugar phosphate isomerase/epimerase [Eubacteriales bacterium mix99]|jgi:sugar phosphate isomerase/epimerase
MKLGVFSPVLNSMGTEEAFAYLNKSGVQAVELGTGGSPGKAHCDPDILLADESKITDLQDLAKKYDLEINALSCHGNGVHPQKEVADKANSDFRKTVLLAEKMGIEKIITFSGCPGDGPNATYPNWVTCPWPDDFLKVLDWQWNEILIPYWKKAAAFAEDHGIKKICFEMHPGFCVYNPETMMKLRNAVGDILGANYDPSHLFWQGIDPIASIRYLGKAIYHFHAKDTKIDPINCAINGVLDTKHYSDEIHRSWVFRSVGYGHDYQLWKDIISNLRMVGYDDVISIEHEDSLMSGNEGLQKAISFLKEVLIYEDTGKMFWA